MATEGAMPNLDEFLAPPPPPCKVCRVPAEYRDTMNARYDAGVVNYRGFARWLAACGFTIGDDAVKRHFERGHR